ncbi:MAG: serine/threonine-protein kinase [Gemmataceae bacterium]
MQPLPRIPGYVLCRRLGGGPMTAVYEARDAESGAACAVKVVRDDWEDQATAAKLLQREARAGLMIRHPHLVRFTHAHVLQTPHFLVMELLPGESLRRRLEREYRLPLAEAVWVVRQAAEAVAALHQAGFLHGDIKPDNVRLIGDGTAVLTDLGFAHRPGENAAFLRAGYVLGTANYLAPELCDELPTEDFSSDLFSLGVTLFEMLTGQLPYPPGSLRQTFRRHRCDPPADVRRLAGPLPPGLAQLIERLLAHRPEDRPRAASVVQQLVKVEIATLRQGFRRAG